MSNIFQNPKIVLDLFLNIDKYLGEIITKYGIWTYAILFLVIFMETGFVVTPFLPGDSLLFAAGTFAALEYFNVYILFILLFVAAVLGDTVNYWIGNKMGPRVFKRESKYIKKEYLLKTQEFYNKHGGKTIVIARFVPIIRTFAPFVAGVGTMSYPRFFVFNVFGGFLWTFLFIFGGYFFGNIPVVKHNFELVIIVIIFLSVLPMIVEVVRSKLRNNISN
jgi:membrane-associated protein